MKNIIVTGANQGIGYYMIQELLRNGCNVTVLDLEVDRLSPIQGNILPVPKEFMADPEKVGVGLARRINRRSYIICHSFGQKIQTIACYMFPLLMGKLMSKATSAYLEKQTK